MQNVVSSAWKIEAKLFSLLECPLYYVFSHLVPSFFQFEISYST